MTFINKIKKISKSAVTEIGKNKEMKAVTKFTKEHKKEIAAVGIGGPIGLVVEQVATNKKLQKNIVKSGKNINKGIKKSLKKTGAFLKKGFGNIFHKYIIYVRLFVGIIAVLFLLYISVQMKILLSH